MRRSTFLIGAGESHEFMAARKFPDLRVYGYDALEGAIVEARKRASLLLDRAPPSTLKLRQY